MTAKLKSSRLREEVANFAGYCMGSSYGDWDPRVDAIQEQVLEGGAAFLFYLRQLRQHYRRKQF